MKNSIAFTIALFSMLVPTACKQDYMDPATAPLLVKTSTAFDITENSVTGTLESTTAVVYLTANGFKVTSTISSNGNGFITQYGHVCSANKSPTLYNTDVAAQDTKEGRVPSEFSSDIVHLEANTIYYVRPFIMNEKGPVYGGEIIVTTKSDTQPPTPDKSPEK